MLKWRMKRGVTGLRPPPGGAHAAATVISYKGEEIERTNRDIRFQCFSHLWPCLLIYFSLYSCANARMLSRLVYSTRMTAVRI